MPIRISLKFKRFDLNHHNRRCYIFVAPIVLDLGFLKKQKKMPPANSVGHQLFAYSIFLRCFRSGVLRFCSTQSGEMSSCEHFHFLQVSCYHSFVMLSCFIFNCKFFRASFISSAVAEIFHLFFLSICTRYSFSNIRFAS